MDMLKKLMEKKGPSKMSPEYKDAKKSMLMELIKSMGDMASEPIKGLKKVTVAAPDKEGLKKGLEKAEELVGEEMPEEESEEVSEEQEEMPEEESEEESSEEGDSLSVEELEKKIRELEQLKIKKMKMAD